MILIRASITYALSRLIKAFSTAIEKQATMITEPMLKSEKMLSIFHRISVQNFPSFKGISPVPCDVCFAIQSVRQDVAFTAQLTLGIREDRQESSAPISFTKESAGTVLRLPQPLREAQAWQGLIIGYSNLYAGGAMSLAS